MEIVFEGDEADEHRIEAFSGAESLAGITRAAVLVAHYVSTGEVRYRAPYSTEVEFFIEAPTEGSLEFPLQVFSEIRGALADHKKKLAVALLLAVLARATGQADEGNLEVGGEVIQSGNVDALAEAATPGISRAHYWIDGDERRITLRQSAQRTVSLDEDTKEYMSNEIFGRRSTIDVSVAALNANSKIGRVYFNDLGRTIPFKVAREATGRTAANLSRYLTQYVRNTGATVNIDYQPIYYADKRLKRILIFDCDPIAGEQ